MQPCFLNGLPLGWEGSLEFSEEEMYGTLSPQHTHTLVSSLIWNNLGYWINLNTSGVKLINCIKCHILKTPSEHKQLKCYFKCQRISFKCRCSFASANDLNANERQSLFFFLKAIKKITWTQTDNLGFIFLQWGCNTWSTSNYISCEWENHSFFSARQTIELKLTPVFSLASRRLSSPVL